MPKRPEMTTFLAEWGYFEACHDVRGNRDGVIAASVIVCPPLRLLSCDRQSRIAGRHRPVTFRFRAKLVVCRYCRPKPFLLIFGPDPP